MVLIAWLCGKGHDASPYHLGATTSICRTVVGDGTCCNRAALTLDRRVLMCKLSPAMVISGRMYIRRWCGIRRYRSALLLITVTFAATHGSFQKREYEHTSSVQLARLI